MLPPPPPPPPPLPVWGPLTSDSFPPDVDVPQPDEKSIITYVSSLYDAMPRVPDAQDGVKANVSGGWQAWVGWGGVGVAPMALTARLPQELQLRWQEYRQLVMLLLQWVRHHTAVFEERKFPSSFEEIEVGVLPGGRGHGGCCGSPGLAADSSAPADLMVPVPQVQGDRAPGQGG